VGAGTGSGGFHCGRERGRERLKERNDRRARPVSGCEREGKGEERSGQLGRSPGREKESGGWGAKRPKGEKKGRDSSFLFFFTNFQIKF